jgi:transglutaminase-like putative cysteine protease
MGILASKTATGLDELTRKQSHISVQRYFEISLLLMLSTAFLTVATTGKLDLISILAVSAAMALKFWSYVRNADYSLAPRTVTRLSVFYLFFYALDFLLFAPGPTLLDRMLQATVHLVLFTVIIKVFSARTYRDYAYLATLSFMMMLAGAVLTVGTLYLVCFGFYLLFAISTFVSYEIKRSVESAPRPAEGPFPSPALNRSAIEKALMTSTVALALGIVALASVLFFIIPRFRTGYLTGLGTDRQNLTGFSETVNLGDIKKILRSNAVVMRVVVDGDPRRFAGVKWRGMALTSFDGKRWYNDNTEQELLQPAYVTQSQESNFVLTPPEGGGAMRRPVEYRVVLSPVSTDVLFAAARARRVSARLRYLNIDQTRSLHNPRHGYAPFGYTAVSDIGVPPPAVLRAASAPIPTDLRLLYLRLPENLDPRIAQLAAQVTSSASDNYDRATAIQNYLRNNYGYSLNPPSIEPSDPIGSFLFKSKEGYCEYFAAAMVLMLRSVQVPARIVNGFQTGTFNRLGGDFIVRARDAHSWVEVYFPGYGWFPFDPTPPDPNPIAGGDWGALEDYYDAVNLFWNEWIINYDFAHQMQLAQQFDQKTRQAQMHYRRSMSDFREALIRDATRLEIWLMAHKLLVLLFMLAVLAYLLLEGKDLTLDDLRFLWAWRFRPGEMTLGPREAAFTYQRFMRIMAKKGYRKPVSQTPREFAAGFAGTGLAWPVSEFTRLYNAFRYGRVVVSLLDLRRLLERIKNA